MKLKKGIFITFEGADYSGKTTQIALVAAELEKLKLKTLLTREPGGTEFGMDVRNLLLNLSYSKNLCPQTQLMLINASRYEHVKRVVNVALAAGDVVISDRYVDSTAVYQGFLMNLGVGAIYEFHKQFFSEFECNAMPDITFYFGLSAEDVITRRSAALRQGQFNWLDDNSHDELLKLVRGYDEIYEEWNEGGRIIKLDANLEIGEICRQIVSYIVEFVTREKLLA